MMLERFWKQTDAEKKVGRPISDDLLAEHGPPEVEERDEEREKFERESDLAASTARGDAELSADDERDETARPEPIHVEPTPLAAAIDETPPDAWLSVGPTASPDTEVEVDADSRFVAADSALPADTSLSPTPSDQPLDEDPSPLEVVMFGPARQPRQRRTRRMAKPTEKAKPVFSPEQRILLLDTWRRSGLPAKDFAALVGVSKHTLYKWKQQFEQHGPEGLMPQQRGSAPGSRLPEVTKRTILMLKEAHPDWGCQRISDMLQRGPALPASASAVTRVLREAGYETIDTPTRPHPQKARRFERAKPNQLWQTDLFTFVLKRQNRRVYLVAFLDDHSRFIVSFGLTASANTTFVIEVLEAAITSYGPPEEILTDNGPQYITWRGKSRFTRHLDARGIRQIVARPKRPQTLGKVERFWGTLWREFLETAVFIDMEDARRRIALFIDHYNFQRTHRGVDGLVPADRFFSAAPDVLRTLRQRVSANALAIARHGASKEPFYVTGQVGGQPFSVHAEGERVFLHRSGQAREEVELTRPPALYPDEVSRCPDEASRCPDGSPLEPAGEPAMHPPLAPGQSGLDKAFDEPTPEHPSDAASTDDSNNAAQEGGEA
jgi:transposase InsO family protein